MFIWRGLGCLVPIVVITVFVIMGVLAEAILGARGIVGREAPASVIWFSVGILSGIALWFLGRRLNGRPGRIVVDRETNREIELKQRHDFFFIPVEYWGPIIAVLCVMLAIGAATG